jgi:hypothetical protein
MHFPNHLCPDSESRGRLVVIGGHPTTTHVTSAGGVFFFSVYTLDVPQC